MLRPAHTAESHRIGATLAAMELAAARSATARRAIVSFCGAGRQRRSGGARGQGVQGGRGSVGPPLVVCVSEPSERRVLDPTKYNKDPDVDNKKAPSTEKLS